jgi:hypothetical protein
MIFLLASAGLLLAGILTHPAMAGISMTMLKSFIVLLFTLLPCIGFIVIIK